MAPKLSYKPLYPDVLGAITGGQRINMEKLECAVGIFPRQAFINQPCELILALQNMVDKDMQIKVAIRLPNTDRKGNVAVIETPKAQMAITMRPGEVGVMRMPIIALPPTQPAKDFPVRVAVRYRTDENAKEVRQPGGSVRPSVLSISPFKLQVLRDVDYVAHQWNESTDIMTVYFDTAPKSMPHAPDDLKPRYEALWTHEELAKESRQAVAYVEHALEMAKSTSYGSAYPQMLEAVTNRFANRGLPLHPGEAMAIAKIMTYTIDEAPSRERNVVVETSRWFRGLCQVLAGDPSLLQGDRNAIIAQQLFEGVLFEAILLAFDILETRVKEDLGDVNERVNYANRLMTWFAGHGEADLSYVYLPLVLCGLIVNRLVRHGLSENPWDISVALTEAILGRMRLGGGPAPVVFDMLHNLIEEYERTLRMQRIERPAR